MNIETPESRESVPSQTVELFDPATQSWEDIQEDILSLEKLCFGEKSFPLEQLKENFENPEWINVLLKQGGKIIGFTSAVRNPKVADTLHIGTTDIHPDEQGKGYVGLLMKLLEDEARERGYQYLTRHAAIDNGYADAIQTHYGDRVVESELTESEYGPQRYFKIAL